MSDSERHLDDVARQRLSTDLLSSFVRLPHEAQIDIALTLLYCAESVPQVATRAHVQTVRELVDELRAELPVGHDVAG